MRRALPSLAGLAIALTACGPVNRGVESVHQPVVSRANYTFDLAEAGSDLAPGEEGRLLAWFDALRVGFGDRIAVDDPTPSRATRDRVAAVAARYGLLLADAAPPTEGEIAPSKVRIVLSRSFASVQGCPDWSNTGTPDFVGGLVSNYGCAANTNLAAMTASAEDLVQGRSERVSNPLSAARAVKSYRDAAPSGSGGTAVQAQSSKGGN